MRVPHVPATRAREAPYLTTDVVTNVSRYAAIRCARVMKTSYPFLDPPAQGTL